jgi:hypothetical protein
VFVCEITWGRRVVVEIEMNGSRRYLRGKNRIKRKIYNAMQINE